MVKVQTLANVLCDDYAILIGTMVKFHTLGGSAGNRCHHPGKRDIVQRTGALAVGLRGDIMFSFPLKFLKSLLESKAWRCLDYLL